MKCSSARKLIMKYMDGCISADEARALNSHILHCEACEDEFLAYDSILDDLLSEAQVLYDVPLGFEDNVMSRIYALDFNYSVLKNDKIEGTLNAIWGLFSILFGFGVMAFIYRDSITYYLANNKLVGKYIENLIPSVDVFNEQVNYLSFVLSSYINEVLMFFSSIRVVFLAALVVLVLIQVFIYNRKQDRVNL